MAIVFTPLMKKRLTRRAQGMIAETLRYFPELVDKTITIGYTRKHLGSATVIYRKETVLRLIIRLKVRKLNYQTVGHELTHLVQGLTRGDRHSRSLRDPSRIPAGEKQCDIWTLARHEIFCDDAPTYLKMPRTLREQWSEHAQAVRALCIEAIQKRNSFRLYIRWLENELHKLGKSPPRVNTNNTNKGQLMLPFG
jgi:hypothetical protein